MNELSKRLEFLKPSTGRIALFSVLMGGLNAISIRNGHYGGGAGLPLGFYPASYGDLFSVQLPFRPMNLIFDLIFWYVISAAIVAAHQDKGRRIIIWALVPIMGTAGVLQLSFGAHGNTGIAFTLGTLFVAFLIGAYRGEKQHAV